MIDRDEEAVVICGPGPIEDYESIVPGSFEGTCADCESTIVISPSTVAILESHEQAKALCPSCGMKVMKEVVEQGEPLRWGTTDKQKEEIADDLREAIRENIGRRAWG